MQRGGHPVSEEVVEEEGHHGVSSHAVVQFMRAQVTCLAGLQGKTIWVEPNLGPLL